MSHSIRPRIYERWDQIITLTLENSAQFTPGIHSPDIASLSSRLVCFAFGFFIDVLLFM